MKTDFLSLVLLAFDRGAIKKLIFSRPATSEVAKVSARLCAHRGRSVLALEYSLPGNTVSHKNLCREDAEAEITSLLSEYRQANLITTEGEAEWHIAKSGKEALLGGEKLRRKLTGESPAFEQAIQSLDRKKDYILSGGEDFLIALGISDKTGRVHDKKQAKYRQINRFLELIEDIYPRLRGDGELLIYDLCCGKSYLSFAVYHYFTAIKGRTVKMLGIDLKRDVITWCDGLARSLGYIGMTFIHGDIRTSTPKDTAPDMVISLHACDIATDIVLDHATSLGTEIILSTPCCHRYINDKMAQSSLSFVTEHPKLRGKLGEVLTDAIRMARLSAAGYAVSAIELVDPDDTPKNTLIRAIRENGLSPAVLADRAKKYDDILTFVLGEGKENYLKEIK
ncbi:MAG: SAM-dependent methyltransferase [Clostridia bacterium]|nr:SAM-dependent methyltransferase [Clostridia bacterium]